MLTENPCSRHSDTLRARRSVHPTLGHHTVLHLDATPGYTLLGSAHTTLGHTLRYTRTPLSDTPELRIRALVPCALTLHYLTVRAPDSCSLKDEHASNSLSELRIRVVFLLMLQLFFFLTNHCSHPEVRMLLLRNLIPFDFCSKTSESLKTHKLLLSITAPFLFPKLRSPYFQLSTDRTPKTQISAPKASTVADVGFVVAVSDRSKEEMKVMVPMKSKNK